MKRGNINKSWKIFDSFEKEIWELLEDLGVKCDKLVNVWRIAGIGKFGQWENGT